MDFPEPHVFSTVCFVFVFFCCCVLFLFDFVRFGGCCAAVSHFAVCLFVCAGSWSHKQEVNAFPRWKHACASVHHNTKCWLCRDCDWQNKNWHSSKSVNSKNTTKQATNNDRHAVVFASAFALRFVCDFLVRWQCLNVWICRLCVLHVILCVVCSCVIEVVAQKSHCWTVFSLRNSNLGLKNGCFWSKEDTQSRSLNSNTNVTLHSFTITQSRLQVVVVVVVCCLSSTRVCDSDFASESACVSATTAAGRGGLSSGGKMDSSAIRNRSLPLFTFATHTHETTHRDRQRDKVKKPATNKHPTHRDTHTHLRL